MRVLCLILLVPAFLQEGNAGEKLFRKMEKQIIEAKALELSFELSMNDPAGLGEMHVKGTLKLVGDKKARLDGNTSGGGREAKITAIADGTTAQLFRDDVASGPAIQPARLNAAGRDGLARSSLFASLEGVDKPQAENFQLSDFKVERKEPVAGRVAQVITFKMNVKKKDQSFSGTVWIDPQTALPLKRVITSTKGDRQVTVTELYTGINFEPKLDAKLFELPK